MGRRDVLRLGALAPLGLALPDLLNHTAAAASLGRAKSVILFFQEGGLAHQDSWDIKPDAPLEVRGPFKAIRNSAGGILCEHMTELAKQAHRYAIVRSVTHDVFDHNPGAYYCLTGRTPVTSGGFILGDRRGNFPTYGAVASLLRRSLMGVLGRIPSAQSS